MGKRGKRATGENERRDARRVGDGGGGEETFGGRKEIVKWRVRVEVTARVRVCAMSSD